MSFLLPRIKLSGPTPTSQEMRLPNGDLVVEVGGEFFSTLSRYSANGTQLWSNPAWVPAIEIRAATMARLLAISETDVSIRQFSLDDGDDVMDWPIGSGPLDVQLACPLAPPYDQRRLIAACLNNNI